MSEEKKRKPAGIMDTLTAPFKEAVTELKKPDAEGESFGGKEILTSVGEGARDMATSAGESIKSGFNAFGEAMDEVGTGVAEGMSKFNDTNPNFWLGAAPLLAGIFAGDAEAGYSAGSEALLTRYKDLRESEAKAASAKSSASEKSQKFNYRGDDGNIYAGSYNPVQNEYKDRHGQIRTDLQPKLSYEAKENEKLSTWRSKGKHLKRFVDAHGQQKIWDTTKGTVKQLGKPLEGLSGDRLAFVSKKMTEMEKDRPAYERYRKAASSVRGFTSKDPSRQRMAFKNMAKVLEGGKLSDFDMIYLQDTFSVVDNWSRRLGQQFKAGKMNDKQMAAFSSEVAKSMGQDRQLGIQIQNRRYTQGSAVGLSPQEMKKHLGELIGFYDRVKYKDDTGKGKMISIDKLENVLGAGYEVIGYE